MSVLYVILTLLILFLLLPVKLVIEYKKSGFNGCLSLLFLKIRFPSDSGKINKSESKNKSQKESSDKHGSLKILLDFLSPLFKIFKKFLRMLYVKKLIADIIIASEDAHSTALAYGGVAATFGTVYPLLEKTFRIKKKSITVNADFERNESVIYLYADIRIRIWQILVLSVYAAYLIIKKFLTRKGNT